MACVGDLTRALFPGWFREDRYGRTGWWWWLYEVTPEQVLRVERRILTSTSRALEREQRALEERIATAKRAATRANGDPVRVRRLLEDAVRDARSHRTLARQKDDLAATASALRDAATSTKSTTAMVVLARVLQARAASASPRQLRAVMARYAQLRAEQRIAESDFVACFDDDADEANAASDAAAGDAVFELAVELGLDAPSQYARASSSDASTAPSSASVRRAVVAVRDVYVGAHARDDDIDGLVESYGVVPPSTVLDMQRSAAAAGDDDDTAWTRSDLEQRLARLSTNK